MIWTRLASFSKKPLFWLFVLSACLGSNWAFFRIQFHTGFHLVFGDRTDGLIEITILEHWWNFLRGLSHWNKGFFFYPIRDSIGYNDAYFLYGLTYSFFRFLKADPLLSSDLTNLTIKVIGFFGCYGLLRVIRMPVLTSALGATLFTLSNNTYVNAYHAQLLSVAFLPCLIIILFRALGAIKRDSPIGIFFWGATGALFYCLWLITTFYTAWFSAFFAVFFAVALLIQRLHKPLPWPQWWKSEKLFRLQLPVVGVGVVALVGLLPFLRIYLPTASETGMHPVSEVMQFSPSLIDIMNVGSRNWLYGQLDRGISSLLGAEFPLSGEHVMGMPPGLLLLAAIGSLLTALKSGSQRRVWIALSFTTLLTWLFTIHVYGMSVWPLFYAYFPAAKAVRVISRYEIILVLPIIMLAMEAVRRLTAATPEGSTRQLLGRYAIGAILGLFLIAEEINCSWPVALQRPQEMVRVYSVPPMPSYCRAFFALNERPGPPLEPSLIDAFYSNNVDSMFIAEVRGMPTLNGMASFFPKGWDLTSPKASDYLMRVNAYLEAKHIGQVCALDLMTLKWVGQPSGRK
ncbi:hypothetical protein [Acidisoma sp. S159]|uniref:hypothetical protein n=1 Tax=Acidisoma sp. S159 TaxID=1747225 RepID=UPI00131C8989|nr:hypothetical protein [Acidisoma sp. S159]